jgi:DNA ligase-1
MTNTGKSVYDAIEEIAATPSKNEKKALIKAAGACPLFMKAITYAYNPMTDYGIRNVPAQGASGTVDLSDPVAWGILDCLIDRSLSGDAARYAVDTSMSLLDPRSAEIFRRIINKDMRAGFSEGSVNAVFKGTFAEYPYMRCTLPKDSNIDDWDWSVGIFSELKADGSFGNVNKDLKGCVWVTSRQGTLYPDNVLGIEPEVRQRMVNGSQTHGELTVYEDGVLLKRQVGNGVLNSLAAGGRLQDNQRVVFDAWDQVPLSVVVPKGSYDVPYEERYARLVIQLRGSNCLQMVETRMVYSKADAYAHYKEKLDQGLEGTVCKHPNMDWYDTGSGGNKDQVKLKLEAQFELRIKGFNPGTPGKKTEATFGSLLCSSECGELEVGVSGMSDAKRKEIHENREKYLDSIITAKGNGVTLKKENGLYSIFLSGWVDERPDKVSADTVAQIQAIFDNAIEMA